MLGLLAPCRTPKLLCVLQVLGKIKQPVPKNGFLGDFEGEDVKILCSNPQKALPCVNMHLLVYHVSKSVQRPEL